MNKDYATDRASVLKKLDGIKVEVDAEKKIGYLILGSAVFVEIVFNWPGLGLLAYQAILARDIPVLLGIIIISSVIFVILNIITDTFQLLIDPRTNN